MKSGTKRKKRSKPRTSRLAIQWHQAIIADYAWLRSVPGVLSVSMGLKEIRQSLTRRICVKIYVERKFDPVSAAHRFPKSTSVLLPVKPGLYKARRVPTDVVEINGIKLIADPATRLDPVPIGAQIGFPLGVGGAGTLGCWVKKIGLTELCFLTAGHVVSLGEGAVITGQSVYQPQPPLSSPVFDPLIIGQIIEGFVGNDMKSDGYLDYAAIAVHAGGRGATNISAELPCISFIRPHLSLQTIRTEKTAVRKYGARTKCTQGLFSAFHEHFTDNSGKSFNNTGHWRKQALKRA